MKRNLIRALAAGAVLLGMCPQALAARLLVPVGKVVGLRIDEGSVTVAAFDDVYGRAAKQAGLKIGDDILAVNGKNVDSADELRQALQCSDGAVEVTVGREGQRKALKLRPEVSRDGPKLGIYVREGISGIGTVTYYDAQRGVFGALGHGVSTPAGEPAASKEGVLLPASVQAVRRGAVGKPGQLKGLVGTQAIGTLTGNGGCGVFGTCQPFRGEALPTGEARVGQASILSNVEGDTVEVFSVEILRLYQRDEPGRDLLLRVTDEKLLEATGGIVAGMSGSPIIQDGKLVGAVTHVLVNDPTTGYGIFIENMLDAAA